MNFAYNQNELCLQSKWTLPTIKTLPTLKINFAYDQN